MNLQTTIRRPARLTIGRAVDLTPLRRESDIEVANVAVRVADRPAFLAIIEAREAQLAQPGAGKPSAMALASPPAMPMRRISQAVSVRHTKAIPLPSGDHVGASW